MSNINQFPVLSSNSVALGFTGEAVVKFYEALREQVPGLQWELDLATVVEAVNSWSNKIISLGNSKIPSAQAEALQSIREAIKTEKLDLVFNAIRGSVVLEVGLDINDARNRVNLKTPDDKSAIPIARSIGNPFNFYERSYLGALTKNAAAVIPGIRDNKAFKIAGIDIGERDKFEFVSSETFAEACGKMPEDERSTSYFSISYIPSNTGVVRSVCVTQKFAEDFVKQSLDNISTYVAGAKLNQGRSEEEYIGVFRGLLEHEVEAFKIVGTLLRMATDETVKNLLYKQSVRTGKPHFEKTFTDKIVGVINLTEKEINEAFRASKTSDASPENIAIFDKAAERAITSMPARMYESLKGLNSGSVTREIFLSEVYNTAIRYIDEVVGKIAGQENLEKIDMVRTFFDKAKQQVDDVNKASSQIAGGSAVRGNAAKGSIAK